MGGERGPEHSVSMNSYVGGGGGVKNKVFPKNEKADGKWVLGN